MLNCRVNYVAILREILLLETSFHENKIMSKLAGMMMVCIVRPGLAARPSSLNKKH